MTIDLATIEAAKEIIRGWETTPRSYMQTERGSVMVARALLDAKLYVDLANKTILAHLDAAGGQEGGKDAGATLGADIVVAVLAHRKERADKAEAELKTLRESIDAMVIEKDAEGWKYNWQVEVEHHGETKRALTFLREAVREAEVAIDEAGDERDKMDMAAGETWNALEILREKTAPHMGSAA